MKEHLLKELTSNYDNEDRLTINYQELSFEEFKELLIEVYTRYVWASDVLMFSSYSYWKNFTYSEWLIIFNGLTKYVETKKQGVFGFETFMKFCYQVLEIDFFSVYAINLSLNDDLRRKILNRTLKHVGLLCMDMDYYSENMKKYDLGYDDFNIIKEKLLKEGACEAEVIDPKKYIEDKGGFKTFYIQSPSIPKSWTWADQYI